MRPADQSCGAHGAGFDTCLVNSDSDFSGFLDFGACIR